MILTKRVEKLTVGTNYWTDDNGLWKRDMSNTSNIRTMIYKNDFLYVKNSEGSSVKHLIHAYFPSGPLCYLETLTLRKSSHSFP